MSPSNNDDQTTAIMASTTTFEEGAATRSRTKEVKRKQLEQATALSMAATSANQQPEAFKPTTETSPEPSRGDEDIEDADIPESVKAVVKDLSERFEESTNPTFGEPATGGINLVQLLLEMKQDLAVNRLEMKQDVAGIKEELLSKMVENEAKLTTDAAARERRALEWQEKRK
jgi:hypothetical protein